MLTPLVAACGRPFSQTASLCSIQPQTHLWNKNLVQTEQVQDVDWNENDITGMEQREEPLGEGAEKEEVPVAEQRSLRVAIIGAPNAGKSTLVNQLLQLKVCLGFI